MGGKIYVRCKAAAIHFEEYESDSSYQMSSPSILPNASASAWFGRGSVRQKVISSHMLVSIHGKHGTLNGTYSLIDTCILFIGGL